MKVTCNRRVLHEALQYVTRIVSGRTTLPILSNVLMTASGELMRLVAYDMELGAKGAVAVDISEEGALTVPARVLSDVVASLPDATVEMETEDRNILGLRCGRSRYTIHGLPAEEYPNLPEVSAVISFELSQAAMRDLIRMTIFAASSDETRAILTGVLIKREGEQVKMVATDAYRLAVKSALMEAVKTDLEEATWGAIIPARALQELSRILDPSAEKTPVRVCASAQQIVFEVGPYTLISRLIEGQFPNYERVISQAYQAYSDQGRRATINREDLLGAIKRAAIVARSEASKLIFTIAADTLTISAESGDVGRAHEEIPITLEGAELEIAFNAEYLSDVLSVMDSETITWEFTGELTQGLIKESHDPEYLHIIMPMQL